MDARLSGQPLHRTIDNIDEQALQESAPNLSRQQATQGAAALVSLVRDVYDLPPNKLTGAGRADYLSNYYTRCHMGSQ